MTRKQQRVRLLTGAAIVLGFAAVLVFYSISDSMVYFYSPSDVVEKEVPAGKRLKVGGLVENWQQDGIYHSFDITDTAETITVKYEGLMPSLFRDGQGTVVEGTLNEQGVVVADEVLAKHDENYMPPEVADALKEKGYWKHTEDGQGS